MTATLNSDSQKTTLTSPLLPDEAKLFSQCESTISNGIKTFWAVGEALETIRQGKLYRATHATFEEYCQERWGIGRSHANKQIRAAGVMRDLETTPILGTQVPKTPAILPVQERQVRPLTVVDDPEMRADAWDDAVRNANGTQPSPAQVAAAVASLRPALPDTPSGDIPPLPEGALVATGAAEQLLDELQRFRNEAVVIIPNTPPFPLDDRIQAELDRLQTLAEMYHELHQAAFDFAASLMANPDWEENTSREAVRLVRALEDLTTAQEGDNSDAL